MGDTGRPRYISIHAPRKGERHERGHVPLPVIRISIHAPRKGERPEACRQRNANGRRFQSTLPARGSDMRSKAFLPDRSYFNPRSPQGGATHQYFTASPRVIFQSTLPARGSDAPASAHTYHRCHFNPRSPQGGATAEKCICMQHFREFAEYYPLRHGDARCIAPQDCIIQAFFGAKKRCFYVRLCFALKNKGVRG